MNNLLKETILPPCQSSLCKKKIGGYCNACKINFCKHSVIEPLPYQICPERNKEMCVECGEIFKI